MRAGYPDSWIALALSESGGMQGADMIIVTPPRVAAAAGPGDSAVDDDSDGDGDGPRQPAGGDSGGEWRVIDAHSYAFEAPEPDDHQVA